MGQDFNERRWIPEQPASRHRRAAHGAPPRTQGLLLLVALSWLLLALAAIYRQFEPTNCGSSDTSIYFSGAQSLAEGRGYKLLAYANEPPITLYPPAQAAYLSLLWRINPNF